jgi:GNAT superfamily N-acetyltransferase
MEIRKGSATDIPAIVGLFDGAMEWLVSQGRTGQWGERPWSERPRAVAMVEEYVAKGVPWIAETDGIPVGTLTLSEGPGSYVEPAGEPERYVHLLAARHGSGAGAALLAHAAEETLPHSQKSMGGPPAGIPLLRVDCYAGDDGKLVAFYEANGFVRTESFTGPDGVWPGQVLARRV